MGYRRLVTLLDIAKQGYWVRLVCTCGHEAKHNPMPVIDLLMRRGASTSLKRLHDTMKCGKCGSKAFTAEHCQGPKGWSR